MGATAYWIFALSTPRPGFAGPFPRLLRHRDPQSGAAREGRLRRMPAVGKFRSPQLFNQRRSNTDRNGPDRCDICTQTTYPAPVTDFSTSTGFGGKDI